jgi:amino-acid N-acetyltransferase
MNIVPASEEGLSAAIDLLKKNNLPTEDIHSGTQLFVIEENNEVLGTVAVEYDYDHALLRSLSVDPEKRSTGMGAKLVRFIEDYVQQQGVREVYILTTTAAGFFSKRGYVPIDRNSVPTFIQNTSEFTSICPSSAAVMKKDLV